MCGITGIASMGTARDPDKDRLRRMVETLRHRGPDDDGMVVDDGVGLGMTRLSIIDVEGGQQPVFNEDRSIRSVFNGEIYNYRELRDCLQERGHVFTSQSDSEVIVHAYEEFGVDFPNHLNGMFAVALHDRRLARLLLVRDPLGIKPLYYSVTNDWIIWGSEIKAILASNLVSGTLDVDGLANFLSWEYVPSPGTLLKEVRKLGPGSLLRVDLREARHEVRQYWDIVPEASRSNSDNDWEARVEDQVARSTRMQMVSDVPLGAFLSGGVDSSLLVASMGNAETFSIGFDDQSYNELPFASKVANHLGVSHIQEVLKPHVADLFDDLMLHLDDPIGDFSIFPTYLVSRLARSHVKVVLSGDGADEVFGGYETYVAENLSRTYRLIPSAVREHVFRAALQRIAPRESKKGLINLSKRFVDGFAFPEELGHARWRLFAGEALLGELFTEDADRHRNSTTDTHILAHFRDSGSFDPLTRSLYVDVKSYLSDNILPKIDRMSMAVSLEARVPYLDKDLVALAFSMPDNLKVKGLRTKILLKKIAARHVPRDCVYRAKEGFSIPIKNWLGNQFRPFLEEYLRPESVEADGVLRSNTIEKLKREHLEGRANHSHVLWALIVYRAWRSRWL